MTQSATLPPAALQPVTLPPATRNPVTLLPCGYVTLLPCDLETPRPAPPSYFFIRTFLGWPGKIGSLYHWFRSQGITLTLASPQAFMLDMVRHVMEGEFFSTHVINDLDLYTPHCPDTLEEFSDDWPIIDLVCVEGINWNADWEDWSELYHFCFCLAHARNGYSGTSDWPYGKDAKAWWQEHTAEYNLPPSLEQVNYLQVVENFAVLPDPWIGLQAIMTWIAGDTANPFIDLSCDDIYEDGYEIDWDWDVETLSFLASSYADAEETVIGPANRLEDLYTRNPTILRTCIDLALGRCNALIWDGELILMDEGVSLAGMPADVERLHVNPRVRIGLPI